MKRYLALLFMCCCQFACPAVFAAGQDGPFPHLLPPASDFHLTLREDPHSTLPLNPSCTGEAGLTLSCRAFTLTLENASKHTIHLSGLTCAETEVTFYRKDPNSSGGWWPVSQPIRNRCETATWTNLRLKPGESTAYATRLIAPRRSADADGLPPGSYTIRASWLLYGCTEPPEGADCLTRLQVIRPPGSVPDVDIQEPTSLISNEITADAPLLHDLGTLKFALEVTSHAVPSSDAAPDKSTKGCAPETDGNIDCTVFHYIIRNLGDRAVRNGTLSCSNSGIVPEYSSASGDWKPVPQQMWVCSLNIYIQRPILPGGTLEGEFTLATLAPGYDTASLRAAGDYRLRFTFYPSACFASPDGSFCIQRPDHQPPAVSQELTRRAIETDASSVK